MSDCCVEPDCSRHYPISLYLGDLSGQVYAVTHRRVVSERDDGTATFAATQRHDVTAQMREFIRRNPEWVREQLEGSRDGAALTSAAPQPPSGPPRRSVVVRPSQVAAAQLMTEHGGCGEHGAAVRKIAGACDVTATQEGDDRP